jgi:histone H3/H4
VEDIRTSLYIQASAINTLQEAAKVYLVNNLGSKFLIFFILIILIILVVNLLIIYTKRVTIQKKDYNILKQLRFAITGYRI